MWLMTEINLQELECKRCGYRWVPRKTRVGLCPHCKSTLWDIPKGQQRLVSTRKKERSKVT